ncbi:MAG: hypothetical protein ACRCYR_20430 [Phycicoccus sp.]
MLTTVDLDERVVVAAHARARQRGTTLGAALSELALAGLAAEAAGAVQVRQGLVMLPHEPRRALNDELVAHALAEE